MGREDKQVVLTPAFPVIQMSHADTGTDVVQFIWREGESVPSEWVKTIVEGIPWYSYSSVGTMCIAAWRMGPRSVYFGRSLNDEYEEERTRMGFSIRLDLLTQRVLTFLCENRDSLASLNLHDIRQAVLGADK